MKEGLLGLEFCFEPRVLWREPKNDKEIGAIDHVS